MLGTGFACLRYALHLALHQLELLYVWSLAASTLADCCVWCLISLLSLMLRVLQVCCYLFQYYWYCAYAQTLRSSYKHHHVWQLLCAHAHYRLLVILRDCLIMGNSGT